MPSRYPRFVAIGELLWDCLPSGRVLGGAPANVARLVAQFGIPTSLISAVGSDEPGRSALAELAGFDIPVETIAIDDSHPTGVADVVLSPAGNAEYDIWENVAWDRIRANDINIAALQQADVVYFGSLVQRTPASRDVLREMIAHVRSGCLKIFDINIRKNLPMRDILISSFQFTDMVRLNEDELRHLADLFGWETDMEESIDAMLELFPGIRHVVLTRGADGALWRTGSTIITVPGKKVDVVDTIGAGDSFTAALVVGILEGMTPLNILNLAVKTSAFVCGRAGATTKLPQEILAVAQTSVSD